MRRSPLRGRVALLVRGFVAPSVVMTVALATAVWTGCGSAADDASSSSSGVNGGGGSGAMAGFGGHGGSSSGTAGSGGLLGGGGTGGDLGGGGAGGGTGGSTGADCNDCHGSDVNPAPPADLGDNTDPTFPGVGAHQSHLGVSSWHHEVTCAECHVVPVLPSFDPNVPTHMNGDDDLVWGPIALQGTYDPAAYDCTGSYCHGATLVGDPTGQPATNRVPQWTTVNGTQAACGSACHSLPPGEGHPQQTSCEKCHAPVVATFDAGDPASSVWADASLHIDGQVQVGSMSCTTCHGDPNTNAINPPFGTAGETQTSEAAVGAHEAHLQQNTGWHANVQCQSCHAYPNTLAHFDGVTEFNWTLPSNADGATPAYDFGTTTCSDVYCHGTTLMSGGTNTTPDWTVVDDSQDACGTCHGLAPGGLHPAVQACEMCHAAVVQSFDAGSPQDTVWADPSLHVNGSVDWNTYHDLSQWVSPKENGNHHGSNYFLDNQQHDEHDTLCSDCHGASLDGGAVAVSCNNQSAGCHNGQDWRSCDFCHGTAPSQHNPPVGVGGETTTNTLSVGKHMAHVTSSSSHVAFTCDICHLQPAAGDVSHAAQYVPSGDLQTPGHHGDTSFSGGGTGTNWNVNATAGNPVTSRGTCLGGCHSDGNGGSPVVTPWWAGGSWDGTPCNNCHAAPPNNGEHMIHVNGESLGCDVCHSPADSPNHMNGQPDVRPTISGPGGGGVNWFPNNCGGTGSCSGNCHGQPHSNYCW